MFILVLALQSISWGITAMFPAVPSDIQVELVQLDGNGPDEILAYQTATGQTWVAFINRDAFGNPMFCIDAAQLPAGYILKTGHIDPWDTREDVVLVPPGGGPLLLAGTILQTGSCYRKEE